MASEWLFPTNQEREDSTSSSRNEELFVFGYACKLFRDDEQAQMVDGGTYMIPWMGDEKLLIDRSVFSRRRGFHCRLLKGSSSRLSIVTTNETF